ncbi:MAG: hypothetical protein M3O93_05625 [Chloroflexota bacterium]|nr:hypothetical protein [Chloroflexota bacterium]
MSEIDVTATPTSLGWVCEVQVRDHGTITNHRVSVATGDVARLAPGAIDPEDLVRRSFEFLLQRESQRSILASFELTDIGRYFPEYEREIRGA